MSAPRRRALAEHLLARAGNREAGTTGQVLVRSDMAGGYDRCSRSQPARMAMTTATRSTSSPADPRSRRRPRRRASSTPGAVVWAASTTASGRRARGVLEWLVDDVDGATRSPRIEIEGGCCSSTCCTDDARIAFSMPACLVSGRRRPHHAHRRVPRSRPSARSVTSLQSSRRVFAWIQPGGESGVSNAGVVVDDDGLTVIDTMMVRSQWEPFVEAIAELELPVKRVVLTHAHIDHVGGTQQFRNAMILGSPATSELLDQPMPLDAYKAFMPAFDEEFDELDELGTRPVSHLVDDAAQLTAAHRGAPRDRSHGRRPHGARRRRRRAVRGRPLLLRCHAARVPG